MLSAAAGLEGKRQAPATEESIMVSWPTRAALSGAAVLAMAALASADNSSHSGMHHQMQAGQSHGQGQAMSSHTSHGGAAEDAREMVQFPPDMQTHFLGNMRDHLQTLNEIVDALARDDYAAASKVATERLGLDSPSAAGCKPQSMHQASRPPANRSQKPMTMEEMMETYMPEAMRGIGLSMHTAASEFAKVAMTQDRVGTMTALSHATQNCVSCHSSYRLR